WNLAQLGTCLLPLMGSDTEAARARAQAAIDTVPDRFRAAWLDRFRTKLGLTDAQPEDAGLVEELLRLMTTDKADFTNTFRGLANGTARDEVLDRLAFDIWAKRWRTRMGDADDETVSARLKTANPAVIPRNHRVEAAISAALQEDLGPTEHLLAALARPYDDPAPEALPLTRPPAANEVVHATFCGT
ncbi:MAG: protein adenylyltransferase SelO family protein, partial [Pseudomonadota bacterium]